MHLPILFWFPVGTFGGCGRFIWWSRFQIGTPFGKGHFDLWSSLAEGEGEALVTVVLLVPFLLPIYLFWVRCYFQESKIVCCMFFIFIWFSIHGRLWDVILASFFTSEKRGREEIHFRTSTYCRGTYIKISGHVSCQRCGLHHAPLRVSRIRLYELAFEKC